MPYIKYEDYNPQSETETLLARCRTILDEYKEEGRTLTVRQLFYQLVSRDVIGNEFSEYRRLRDKVSKGRKGGYLDWGMIVDRGRPLRQRKRWDSPEEILKASARDFHIDLWQDQRLRPEVWIEKNALVEVIADTCRRYDVPYRSSKGYDSDSKMWRAAQRFGAVMDGEKSDRDEPAIPENDVEQIPVVLHLSDRDPSGFDMTRDLKEKFELFGLQLPIKRFALTMQQVREHDPPPSFAKRSDTRYESYVEEQGTRECWELDALEPAAIESIVEEAIQKQIPDRDAFDARKEQREEQRNRLEEVSERWTELFE